MKVLIFSVLTASAVAVFVSGSPARAGGLYLGEYNISQTGTANAGAAAIAADASTAVQNPAGMTRLNGNALTLGAGAIASDVEFETQSTVFSGGDGGQQGGIAPLLNSTYVQTITDDLKVGLGLYSISGSALDPDDDWVGRFAVQELELVTVSGGPSIGYQVADRLSVGGGVYVTYANIDYTLAAPPPGGTARVNVDADDVAYSFSLGALYELNERTRFGLVYLSETDIDLSGDVSIDQIGVEVGLGLDLPLAQTVRGSIYHELNDQWALLGTLAWEDWSILEEQLISTDAGSAVLPRNWEDTWHISAGVQYRPANGWLLQTGVAYDSSPVDAEDRTPDLPVDRQIRLAAGAEYELNQTTTLGASLVYVDLGDAEINRSSLRGEYDNNRYVFLGLYSKWMW